MEMDCHTRQSFLVYKRDGTKGKGERKTKKNEVYLISEKSLFLIV